ncbi:MAG: type III pantothenate kinase [Candidatus Sumerlaeota bacterium]|nr:type III pantothenate kinase [Candidatus Sumerlaeota bacterium]
MTTGKLLVIDIGNSSVKMGVYEGDVLSQAVVHPHEFDHGGGMTAKQFARMACEVAGDGAKDWKTFKGAAFCSVAPAIIEAAMQTLQRMFGGQTLHVKSDTHMPVKNGYLAPKKVGVDRLVGAVGGASAYGAPLIVVDAGTAITVDVISRNREFLGGAILTGIKLSATALADGTAALPLIKFKQPSKAIGRTTIESIRSGLYIGTAGAVDRIIERAWEELGYETPVVATGGGSKDILSFALHITRHDSDLTLLGLKQIWEMNREGMKRILTAGNKPAGICGKY